LEQVPLIVFIGYNVVKQNDSILLIKKREKVLPVQENVVILRTQNQKEK
jgi:hypothetical protein